MATIMALELSPVASLGAIASFRNKRSPDKARRIRQKLALVHGVVIALVPWLLDSSTLIYGRRSRPLPGQDRRGEPRRPVARRPMPPAKPGTATKSAGTTTLVRPKPVATKPEAAKPEGAKAEPSKAEPKPAAKKPATAKPATKKTTDE